VPDPTRELERGQGGQPTVCVEAGVDERRGRPVTLGESREQGLKGRLERGCNGAPSTITRRCGRLGAEQFLEHVLGTLHEAGSRP
jgi:hypothetical protein